MWTELFFSNKEPLVSELEIFMKEMQKYITALKEDDVEGMRELLRQGRIAKERSDK